MTIKSSMPTTKSKFLEVKCKDCENTQIIFNKGSTTVHCQVCGATLATPGGGKAKIHGSIIGVLE